MELLLFSDIHRDHAAARSIVERSVHVDVVVGAGDFAVQRQGLDQVIDILRAIERPTVLVAGNGESPDELRRACEGWARAHVLHGDAVEIEGLTFFGLGGAVPVTPFGDWSYDIPEDEAAGLLAGCPEGAVLVSHSPPNGHVDSDGTGKHHGSTAVLDALRAARPRLVVCGHIHACWGQRSREGDTTIINAGPGGLTYRLS